jgi:hypothetical protein
MIAQQSLATALAERPIGNQKPVISSPSPRGEGWGEGELNLRGPKSALTFILTPDFWILNSGLPSLIKPIEGYSSLLKPFFKNPFFIGSHVWQFRRVTQHIGFIPSEGVLKAKSNSRKAMQGKKSILLLPSLAAPKSRPAGQRRVAPVISDAYGRLWSPIVAYGRPSGGRPKNEC